MTENKELQHGCQHPLYSDFICTIPGCTNGPQLSEEGERIVTRLVNEISDRAEVSINKVLEKGTLNAD